MSSSTNTAAASKQDAAAADDDKSKQQPDGEAGTVKKTVQTVEVRSSAGQPEEEVVLKPVAVVHEIPANEAQRKELAVVKQD